MAEISFSFDGLEAAVQRRFGSEGAQRRSAEDRWRVAGEAYFSETQRLVHIYTGKKYGPYPQGYLKASGELRDIYWEGDTVVAEVAYTAPYAVYEFARGGDHDALNRAFESTEQIFAASLRKWWADLVGG